MKQAIICPFCKRDLPLDKNLCQCGAYRVTEETHHLPLIAQPYYKEKGISNAL